MEQVKQFKKYAYLALMFAPLVVSLFVYGSYLKPSYRAWTWRGM